MSAQALAALTRANEIRITRAALKRRVAAREVSREGVGQILLDPPSEIRGMKVGELIMALPGFGPTKRQALLRRAGIKPTTTIGDCPNIEWVHRCLMEWPGRPK